ncbi:hypothetical protein FJU30_16755 [Affinibrenneria salicis]|uniref:Uncharacterized protein n=1 Tax=Affinibrenneria salicis TaxID=2590031 RepID=A0A5J5FW26_9GAMM|nr:hypothetical protein [Affinibrenneria salicis]KAA8998069.1 hypothetical protein FJU30_16755 [Affinibrenneria salicis]
MNFRNKIFLFWGVMDAIAVSSFVQVSLLRGHIPLVDDYLRYQQLAADGGSWIGGLFFYLHALLLLSLIATAALFLKQSPLAIRFAWFQLPLRLLLIVPSISVFTLLAHHFSLEPPLLNLLLLLISEGVKVYSLYLASASGRKARRLSAR